KSTVTNILSDTGKYLNSSIGIRIPKRTSSPFFADEVVIDSLVVVDVLFASSLLQATKPVANKAIPNILKIVFFNRVIVLKCYAVVFLCFVNCGPNNFVFI